MCFTVNNYNKIISNTGKSGRKLSLKKKYEYPITTPNSSYIWKIAYAADLDLYYGLTSTSKIVTSVDGFTFTQSTIPSYFSSNAEFSDICYSPEIHLFCAVTIGDQYITSKNGTTFDKYGNIGAGHTSTRFI